MDFEKLYQELATNAETIRALVSGISQEEAQVKPTPDDWSILEVICHLYDEEHIDFRPRLAIILQRSTDEFPPNNPQEWVTERGYNERDLAEVLEHFLAERQRSLVWLKSLSGSDWDTLNANNYRSLHAGDMFAAWVEHDTHHMRQLVELRRARIVALSQPYSTDYAGDW
jgi:uncharacterized damage-inducible protein DinB